MRARATGGAYLERRSRAIRAVAPIIAAIIMAVPTAAAADPVALADSYIRDRIDEKGGCTTDQGLDITPLCAIALVSTPSSLPPSLRTALLQRQDAAGAWALQPSGPGSTTLTAAGVIASAMAGETAAARSGMAWLRETQLDDGAWGAAPGLETNDASSVWAITALLTSDSANSSASLTKASSYLAARESGNGTALPLISLPAATGLSELNETFSPIVSRLLDSARDAQSPDGSISDRPAEDALLLIGLANGTKETKLLRETIEGALAARQHEDGGWGTESSNFAETCLVMFALAFRPGPADVGALDVQLGANATPTADPAASTAAATGNDADGAERPTAAVPGVPWPLLAVVIGYVALLRNVRERKP